MGEGSLPRGAVHGRSPRRNRVPSPSGLRLAEKVVPMVMLKELAAVDVDTMEPSLIAKWLERAKRIVSKYMPGYEVR